MTALVVGTFLALVALTFVLYPLLGGSARRATGETPGADLTGGSNNDAIEALKEIEFDRATGKLSDSDYESLKTSVTNRAITGMRSGDGKTCPRCGARPEADATFCSSCGARLA